MSDSLLVLPSSYVERNNIDKSKLIDDTPYYQRTQELISLLLDIGAVIMNSSTGLIEFKPFISSKVHPNVFVGRLLGYIAEGIVVRACNESLKTNKLWANLARVLKQEKNIFLDGLKKIFYEPFFLEDPNEYKAIGIGFAKTAKDYGHLYNPLSDRDVCWIHGFDDAKQLLSVEGVKLNKQRHAGLQLKVSIDDKARYVVNYFCSKPYYQLYPVVYFDLGEDFYAVRKKLLDIVTDNSFGKKVAENSILNPNIVIDEFKKTEIIDIMLKRGKDIDYDLHEELKFYQHILKQLVLGEINLFDLNNDSVIISLIIEYLAVKNVLNNQKQESILSLSF